MPPGEQVSSLLFYHPCPTYTQTAEQIRHKKGGNQADQSTAKPVAAAFVRQD